MHRALHTGRWFDYRRGKSFTYQPVATTVAWMSLKTVRCAACSDTMREAARLPHIVGVATVQLHRSRGLGTHDRTAETPALKARGNARLSYRS